MLVRQSTRHDPVSQKESPDTSGSVWAMCVGCTAQALFFSFVKTTCFIGPCATLCARVATDCQRTRYIMLSRYIELADCKADRGSPLISCNTRIGFPTRLTAPRGATYLKHIPHSWSSDWDATLLSCLLLKTRSSMPRAWHFSRDPKMGRER